MKQKFAILTVLGALVALAIPASSGASMSPASTKFEISTTSQAPRLLTSLGSCSLKVTGETPKSPENLTANLSFAIPAPSVFGCTGGASATVSGEWKAQASGNIFNLFSFNNPEAVVLRFSSLPSCKLTTLNVLHGWWSNGVTSPSLKSGFHAFETRPATWANDGGSCAVAGKSEPYSFVTGTKTTTEEGVSTLAVNNLTSATTPIIVGN